MAKDPNLAPDRYAKLFRVTAASALLIPPILLAVALLFYFMGLLSHGAAINGSPIYKTGTGV